MEALHHGELAESYFGSQPKQIADEILKQIPKVTNKKKGQLSVMVIGIFWISMFLNSFIFSRETIIQPLGYFLSGLLVPFFILIVFKLAQREIYKKSKKAKVVIFLKFYLVFLLFVSLSGLMFIGFLDKGQFIIKEPYNYLVLITMILVLLGMAFSQKLSKQVQSFSNTWLLVSLCAGMVQMLYHWSPLPETVIAISGYGLVCVAIMVYLLVLGKLQAKKEAV